MKRRRLIVYAVVVVLGVLVGFLLLPNSHREEPPVIAANPDTGEPTGAITPTSAPEGRTLPTMALGGGQSPLAQQLFQKAAAATDANVKLDTLTQAYQADQTGTWGGEAAAAIGDILQSRGDPKARDWYVAARKAPLSPDTLIRVNAQIAEMNKRTEVAVAGAVNTISYKVQSGDSLWKIAKTYAVTHEAIMKANNMTKETIRAGSVLKVPKGPFDVLVTKHSHTLQLLQEGKAVKTYEVGLGTSNSTPAGSFTVQSKLPNPVWYNEGIRIPPGDPRNLLGSRWIGFNGRIGIHGIRKTEEGTIGQDSSQGCVRMRDEEVKELYDFLAEGKSKVTVVE